MKMTFPFLLKKWQKTGQNECCGDAKMMIMRFQITLKKGSTWCGTVQLNLGVFSSFSRQNVFCLV